MQRCGGQGGTSTRFFIDQCCQGILQEIPLEMPLNMPEIDMARYEAENDQMCFLCFMSFCVFFLHFNFSQRACVLCLFVFFSQIYQGCSLDSLSLMLKSTKHKNTLQYDVFLCFFLFNKRSQQI